VFFDEGVNALKMILIIIAIVLVSGLFISAFGIDMLSYITEGISMLFGFIGDIFSAIVGVIV